MGRSIQNLGNRHGGIAGWNRLVHAWSAQGRRAEADERGRRCSGPNAATCQGLAGAWDGQMLVIFIITVAACEAGIALALILMLARRTGQLDAAAWQDLREEGQPAFVDRQVPEEREEEHVWPHLTPAGVRPT